MSYADLIVKDDEFYDAGKNFNSFHTTLSDAIKQYKTILVNISTSAVASGKTHDALVMFIEYINKLEVIVSDLAGRYETIINNYLEELENADDYLYDAGISDMARDFTQDCYDHLISCLDDPWCSITDSFGDWLYDRLIDILNFFNFDRVKAWLNTCHCSLLDFNDEMKQGLRIMFDTVHAIDGKYGISIAGGCGNGDYRTCAFAYINLTMYSIRDLLDVMAEIINPASGSFTAEEIDDRLGKPYQELLKYYNETVSISKIGDPPTIGQISDFAFQVWAESFFNDFNSPLSEYLANIGDLETIQIILFNMFGIAKDKILLGGDGELTIDEILALFTGNYTYLMMKRGQDIWGGEEYDIHLKKQQLLLVLQEMSDNYHYSGSDEEKMVSDCKIFLEFVEKYGEGWYDKLNTTYGEDGRRLLDGRSREAKQFKAFLDSVGNAQDILKYGEEAVNYIARLFADYSAGLEVLESVERNFSGDENFQEALSQVRELYNKEFDAWVKEAGDIILENGYEAALKLLGESVPVVAVINAIEETIDIAGEISGLGTQGKHMYDSLIRHSLCSSSYSAYSSALATFKATDPGSETYEQAAKDLEHCFNLHKQNIIALYESMAEATSGKYRAYYKYCAKQAETLSIKTSSQPDLLSFEEFCAVAA